MVYGSLGPRQEGYKERREEQPGRVNRDLKYNGPQLPLPQTKNNEEEQVLKLSLLGVGPGR